MSECLVPDGLQVLRHENGAIAGYCFEPSDEYRAAVEAWLVPLTPEPPKINYGAVSAVTISPPWKWGKW